MVLFSTSIFAKSTPERVLDKVEAVADSAKVAVKEGVHAVDTSSNFRLIYTDMRDGIAALATSLKVGAEHVYMVLVKQQVVYAISYTILDLALIITTLVFMILFYRNYSHTKDINHPWYKDDMYDHFGLIGNLLLFMFFGVLTIIIIGNTATDIITGFINPEYGAIQTIINLVKDAKN